MRLFGFGPMIGRLPDYAPPPCVCDAIEKRVEDACAMRDEMAAWKTPLEDWKALQTMPVLVPKRATPKPVITSNVPQWAKASTHISSSTAPPLYERSPKPAVRWSPYRCDACGADIPDSQVVTFDRPYRPGIASPSMPGFWHLCPTCNQLLHP